MRILMISIGNDILCEGSSTQRRHFEYGKICDELHILVLHSPVCAGRPNPSLPAQAGQEGNYENGNVKIYAVSGKNKISRFFNGCKLAGRIMRENKINLITTQDAGYTGLIGYCLKKKFRVKLNVQIHGLEEKFLNKILFLSLKKKIIKNADSIRVVSERMKKRVMEKYGVDEKKIFKIPICIDTESGIMNQGARIRNQESGIRNGLNASTSASSGQALAPPASSAGQALKGGNNRTDFTILTVSRLVKVKNIKLQIEAMAEVIKIFSNVKLIIAGDGPEKENLQKLANKLKLKDKVIFSGWQKNLAPYYKNADLFLLTSDNEGWGMVVIEAMASGLPVIMTDAGCAGEVVKNAKNGIVIPTGDKKALIAAISEMISDKEKRKVFAEKGLETVSELPDKDETLRLYKSMWK